MTGAGTPYLLENRASKNRSLNIAFVLTPDLLKRSAVILREASERLEFTVKFADGTSVHLRRRTPLDRCCFEIYASVVLRTKYNDFDTH